MRQLHAMTSSGSDPADDAMRLSSGSMEGAAGAAVHGAAPAAPLMPHKEFSGRFAMDDTILIIDQEPDIRDLLESILTQNGYRVQTASGRLNAMDAFKIRWPSLIIMETRLGGQEGLGLLRRFKEMDADVEVIVLTGNATLDNAVRAMRGNGAFDFLTKPLEDVSQLLRSVDQALVRHHSNRRRSILLRRLEGQAEARPMS